MNNFVNQSLALWCIKNSYSKKTLKMFFVLLIRIWNLDKYNNLYKSLNIISRKCYSISILTWLLCYSSYNFSLFSIRPSIDGTNYGMAMSVRPSVNICTVSAITQQIFFSFISNGVYMFILTISRMNSKIVIAPH